MNRCVRNVIRLVLISVTAGFSVNHADWASAGSPNIVLIVSDDQGYNDLGLVNDQIITPNLNRIAREGVRLTNFYVTWPACTPSRGSLLTGRYPQRNGVYDMIRNEAPDHGYIYSPAEYEVTFERIGGMDTREVLISKLLQEAGYVCGIFGKWDLGSLKRFLPTRRGFDEFYGFVNTGIDFFTHERYGVPSMYRNEQPTVADKGTYATDLFKREAIKFLKTNREKPFFLYLPFNAPHSGSNLDPKIRGLAQAPEKWRRKYPELHAREGYVRGQRYGKPAMKPNKSMRQSHYRGCVTAMDAAIGEILDLLDDYALADNTIVIFLSDNGGAGSADNGQLRGKKGQMFEGGIRVLSLVRFPGRIPQGTTSDEFLSSMEIFPMLVRIAGAQPRENIQLDGFDMLPVIAGKKSSSRTTMFWKRRNYRAARIDNWKWIKAPEGSYLFDLSDDIAEQNNLLQSMSEKAAGIESRFNSWLNEVMVQASPRGPFKDF